MVPSRERLVRRLLAAVGRFLAAGIRGLGGTAWVAASAPQGENLVDCPSCGADFMCPLEWECTGAAEWSMQLRCGACEASREIVVTDAEAAAFDRVLNRQTAVMQHAVAKLDRERMAAEVDSFVAALRDGRIDPSAFAA